MKKQLVASATALAMALGGGAAPSLAFAANDGQSGAAQVAQAPAGDGQDAGTGDEAPSELVEVEITVADMPESVAAGDTTNSALKAAVERLNLDDFDSITALKVTTAAGAFLRPEDNMWLKENLTNVSYLDESECACSKRKLSNVYLTDFGTGNMNGGYLENVDYQEFGGLSGAKQIKTLVFPKTAQVINSYYESASRGGGIDESGLTSLNLPDSLILLENGSCFSLADVKGDIVIPDSVILIGNRSLGYVNDQTVNCGTLTLGKSVENINKNAFQGRKFSGDLVVPASVKRIDSGVFEKGSFENGTWTLNPTVRVGVLGEICSGNKGTFTIPETMGIDSVSFGGNTFEKIVFEGERDFIPNKIIAGSSNVTEVVLPENVKYLGETTYGGSFDSCTSLKDINLPEGLLRVGPYTFRNCTALSGAVLPSTVTFIGEYAYSNSGVLGVYLPSSLSAIRKHAFTDLPLNSVIYCSTDAVYHEVADHKTDTDDARYTKERSALAVTNGGTFAADTQFVAGELAEPSLDGYTFAGWYEDAGFATPAAQAESGAYEAEPGKTYYAKFVTRISFDANGGKGAMDAQDVTAGDADARLNESKFEKTGYTFAGWNTAADGSGLSCGDKTEASVVSDGTTLYAQWRANSYKVVFDANGGTGSMDEVSATYDVPFALGGCSFTAPEGKRFAGWAGTEDDAKSQNVKYSPGSRVSNLTAEPNGTATLYAVWTDKDVWEAPDLENVSATYDGGAHGYALDEDYKVSYTLGGEPVDGLPVHAGTYDAVITRDGDATHAAFREERAGGVVIGKAKLTVKADDKGCYVGDELPEPSYSISGWQGGDAQSAGSLLAGVVIDPAYPPDVDAGKAGSYAINVSSNVEELRDYVIELVPGTLTVSDRPVSPSTTVTTTVTNPDGSVTTTVTDKRTGDESVTTTYKDGVVVKTVKEKGAEPRAKVTLPRGVASATVTLPVEAGAGTVAVDAATGEPVGLCAPAEGGLAVRVSSSCELVVRENAKPFGDVEASDWFAPSVAFASARGVMNGVGGTGLFEPGSAMTRAMAAQALWNLAGNPAGAADPGFGDVAAGAWYGGAVAWAAESGVARGYEGAGLFGPDDGVTREQFAVMLLNYAKQAGLDVSARADLSAFSDAGALTYGEDAMEWAVAEGLFRGYEGTDLLGPTDGLDRAQCAALAERMVGLLVIG